MATTETHQFQNIMLGGRGGTSSGQLRIHPGGFIWRKTGGGKVIEVSKADISNVSWTRVPRGYQLGVRLKAGSNVKFNGFKEQEVSSVSSFLSGHLGMVPEERVLSVSGRNWGHADLDGNMLSFDVGGKQAFELALADVSQAQLQGKNDVVLEFHVDDTAGANEKDCLMEMTFHVPITNSNYVGDDNNPPAQVFCDKITSMADIGSSATEAVAFFKEIAILTPRGRYSVELHFSFLHLQGFQANDFKIQYNSVVRLFVLPKSNQPHTFLVITLDPPIRKGQTFYPHIVLQFPADNTIEMNLTISEELLTTKYKDRLQASYQGLEVEVFAQILRGLSGAKVTRPGKFRSNIDGYAVRASLKAEDGVLYPLEKAFFFLPKPPTLILHDEIDYLEFERHGAGGSSSMSSHYFDLVIRLKSEQEHQFRNIQRNEYHKLFNFINSKNLRIINLPDAQGPTGVAAALGGSDDETLDPHLERIRNARDGGANDSDEEDEDFVAEKDDAGSPTDDSEAEGSDASEDGGEEKPAKEKRKEPVAPKPTASKKKKREEGEGDGKKKRKKKDPNAPKRAISSFMYFSQAEREVLKKTNPGLPFKEVGKVIGERWKKLSEEEKEPYETSAKRDRDRYLKEMAEYRRSAGQPVVGNDDSAGEESE